MSSEHEPLEKSRQHRANPSRRKRRDAGTIKFQERDEYALTWIGYQYGIRLDHLQWVLGHSPGPTAHYPNWISESAARDVVRRWERGKWAQRQPIGVHEPFWIWPTRLGLRKVGLPYSYRKVGKMSLEDLEHLYAINEIRIHMGDDDEGTRWVSERQLLQGLVRKKGKELLHRPDAEIHWADGMIYAVEAEMSAKKPFELAENLMELLRGEEYLHMKVAYGWQTARSMSRGARSHYDEIWYFAPRPLRQYIQRQRARLIEQGDISEQEARRLFIRWYPLVEMGEETEQEEQEDEESLFLTEKKSSV
jgi:hypothetical protein